MVTDHDRNDRFFEIFVQVSMNFSRVYNLYKFRKKPVIPVITTPTTGVDTYLR